MAKIENNELWIATDNTNKVKEYATMFAPYNIVVKSLLDLPTAIEIIEDGETFAQNALKKALTLSKKINKPVIADDSGLTIDCLNGFPGVKTKRWSGSVNDDAQRNALLLSVMANMENRTAQATCALVYVDFARKIEKTFLGVTQGEIIRELRGDCNFGFDPIFWLPEIGKTYGEMDIEHKNAVSHRSKAVKLFLNWWKGNAQQEIAISKPFKLHIVMYEPEIAGNVGTIMRTCVALDAKLHLIEPFGFFLDDRFVTRASANYIEFLDYATYADWNDFCAKNTFEHIYCSTRYGVKTHDAIDFACMEGDVYVMFGRESTGIPKSLLRERIDDCFRIPMSSNVRSLNVANTVNIVGYEIMRQRDYPNLCKYETQKDPFLLYHEHDGEE